MMELDDSNSDSYNYNNSFDIKSYKLGETIILSSIYVHSSENLSSSFFNPHLPVSRLCMNIYIDKLFCCIPTKSHGSSNCLLYSKYRIEIIANAVFHASLNPCTTVFVAYIMIHNSKSDCDMIKVCSPDTNYKPSKS